MTHQTHTLIIGGGILALTIARELLKKGHDDILIIEKEPALGMHASGRNSGVLHAGIYYANDSLKAKFCLSGNLKMQTYCESKGIPVRRCGKVVVAQNEADLKTLNVLYERATRNGAKVDYLDTKQLAEIEPWAKTFQSAIYSHDTAIVDPKSVIQALYQELLATKKVRFLFNTRLVRLAKNNIAVTNERNVRFKFLINAAGAYADHVAKQFGLAKNLVMLPFKGIYRQLCDHQKHRVNGNIYPVPNIHNPFLGVHFTKNSHGDVYIGPTAIPAFGRENYGLLSGMDKEALSIASRSARLFFSNGQFRQVALTEPKKYFSSYFYRCANSLVSELKPNWLVKSSKAGIRPQLINWQTKELVMDFLLEQTENSLHVLNAISPAFTASMAMAEFIVDKIKWDDEPFDVEIVDYH